MRLTTRTFQLTAGSFLLCLLTLGNLGCGGASSVGGGGGNGGGGGGGGGKITNPPPQPADVTPINGEMYYVMNQSNGLEADLINNSAVPGDHIVQESRNFTN